MLLVSGFTGNALKTTVSQEMNIPSFCLQFHLLFEFKPVRETNELEWKTKFYVRGFGLFVSKLFGKLYAMHTNTLPYMEKPMSLDKILYFMHCRLRTIYEHIHNSNRTHIYSVAFIVPTVCIFFLLGFFFFRWKHKLNKGEVVFPINETHAHGLIMVSF